LSTLAQSTQSLVQIGITTRNRWEDLHKTLERINSFGLGEFRIAIFDDASDSPCPYRVNAICGGATLRRFAGNAGLIVRRNQLARELDSKYYFSLDDDSFPISGSLDAAVEFAESREDLFCLSFPIYNPVRGFDQVRSLKSTSYRVRSFIGCGHLLRRDRFLELGGYTEEFVHQGEEAEIAVRAFQAGLSCYHFPGLQIHHTESNSGRNRQRMDYYGARNAVLWNDWYVPRGLRGLKQARGFVARVICTLRAGGRGQLHGYFAGLSQVAHYKNHRHPMDWTTYRQWKALPYH